MAGLPPSPCIVAAHIVLATAGFIASWSPYYYHLAAAATVVVVIDIVVELEVALYKLLSKALLGI